jgi:hypothetical protein
MIDNYFEKKRKFIWRLIWTTLILLTILLFLGGCEPENFIFYGEPSEPHLTGGTWTFVDYRIQVIHSISPVVVIENDTICINAFGEQKFVNGDVLMQQYYNLTPADRRFIKGRTLWEFDDNSYSLYCNNNINIRYPVNFPNYMMKEYDKMEITNPLLGSVTTYSFESNAVGANYPTELVLETPEIVSDLYLSNGMRDKAVTVKILLIFRR